MRKKLSALTVAALGVGVLLGGAAPALAHHSFSAEYDAKKPFTLKGTIVTMEWVNPHSLLVIDVKAADGKIERWQLEFGTPNMLFRRGWTYNSLPVGKEVTVTGYRCKDGATCGNAANVVLPDGKKLFAGSGDNGAPPEAQQ